MQSKYVILTSAYNEAAHIEHTIRSVIKQSLLPQEWVIIDDGSTDKTAELVRQYAKRYDWIKLFCLDNSQSAFGAHAVVNFYRAYERLTCNDWSFVCKLDADLDIDRTDFFEYQLQRFDENPKLGISSGITYSTHTGVKILTKGRPSWRTGGAMKFYRRECLEAIDGLKPIYGWDGLDEYQSMYYGWETRTFFDLEVNHLGKVRALKREKTLALKHAQGVSMARRGYPWEFVLAKAINTVFKGKYKEAYNFLLGFCTHRNECLVTDGEKKFIRRFQYKRLFVR